MACEPAALMDQDTWLSAVLTSRPTVTLDGDTLTLTADGTVITFVDRESANPDLPLEGTTWNVEGLVSNDAVSSIPAGGRVPTLRFDGGTVAVDTGCNTGPAPTRPPATEITFGPIALTRMACRATGSAQTERRSSPSSPARRPRRSRPTCSRLTNGANGLVLRAAPEGGTAPEGLEGVPWLLDSIVDANMTTADRGRRAAADAPVRRHERRRRHRLQHRVRQVHVAGDQITFGPLAMTLMLCEGITNDVEQAQLAVLTGTATATIADGVLTLMNGDQGLHYTAG